MKAFFVLLLTVLVVSAPSAYIQNRPAQRTFDLNGLWNDNGRLVGIGQTGTTVVAMFKTPPKCDPQDDSTPRDRPKDFEGQITGNTIKGKITVCNYGKKWGAKIGIQEVDVTLEISEDQNTLSGTYTGWNGPVGVTITRECKLDPRKLCDAIGRALQKMRGSRTETASAEHFQSLQENVGAELNNIRNNVCDKPEETEQVNKLQKDLDALNFVPGQSNYQNNLALSRIQGGLEALSNSQCSAFNPPPPPPPCAEGSVVKTDEDNALLNSFKTRMETNLPFRIGGGLSQTKRCLTDLLGQRCAPSSLLADLRAGAQTWDEGIRPAPELCNRMCQSLGDWYEASACRGGFEKSEVVNRCTFTCRNINFYPE